jgi:proline dehydrogenase
MGIARSVLLWGSQNRWIENQFRRRRFAKKAVSRFMPGEDVDSALAAARQLHDQHIRTVLTYLGENVTSADQAQRAAQQYVDVLGRIAGMELDGHVSVKLTQLGLDIAVAEAVRNLEAIVEHAAASARIVWIDMEASNYVDPTLEVFRTVRARHENLGLCLQAYLHRTPKDLQDLLAMGAAIRLVKGAYQEPTTVALQNKEDVNQAFLDLGVEMAEHPPAGANIAHGIATHDVRIIDELGRIGTERQWDQGTYEVLMLYGIRKPDQLRLAASGVPVRVLISYGEAWFAWYMRRLAERPANVGFVVRSMFSPR